MACCDSTEKSSLDSDCCGAMAEMTPCAAAMEKEYWSPTESCTTLSLQTEAQVQGYDVEFDPPLESKYECPICLMALRAAVQTPCGHRFCHGCLKKSIRDNGKKCPLDNEGLTEASLFTDNFANREILSLIVRCPNAGCRDKMELRHLEGHVAKCKFATVLCPQCEESVLKSQLEEHAQELCLRRIIACHDCLQPFVFEESKVHELICPFANVVCQYCNLELIRDQLESHRNTDCLKAPVDCTFSFFGCSGKMQRNDLAQHMSEFTGMHMRYMAEYLRKQSLNGSSPALAGATGGGGASGGDGGVCTDGPRADGGANAGGGCGGGGGGEACPCAQELRHMNETVKILEGRVVLQDQQLRELTIRNDTQAGQLTEARRKLSALEATVEDLQAQQCQGVYVWRVEGFSAHLRSQEAGQAVVLHSPGFYTGRPGYKLCLRLHLQTPSAPRCANYISLFVHTLQGEFDSQLSWPFQGTIRLAILDQADGQHHIEVMDTKPDLQAFQRPTTHKNPKGFGYVTFLHLTTLQQRQFVRDDVLLVRCEAMPRFDPYSRREGIQPRGPEPSL
ncbi:TNF receptor-associated factor 6 [Engraulis encrasicolus]|uniref:TNF receptor-associated factor 6 n=1 Tax=Engraulis encrasicolus TaxID=184585 RepID=UPI002FCE6EC4